MPDTQYIQYVGGLQIVALDFVNSVEEYDEVLEKTAIILGLSWLRQKITTR